MANGKWKMEPPGLDGASLFPFSLFHFPCRQGYTAAAPVLPLRDTTMRFFYCLAALAAVVLAGCASQPLLIQAAPATGVTVSYEGRVGDTGAPLAVPEYDGAAKSDRMVRIEAFVIAAPADLVASALENASIPRAMSLTPEQAAELSARLVTFPTHGTEVALRPPKPEVELTPEQRKDSWAKFRHEANAAMASPVVTAYSGQRCTLEISNELAYIGGFEINSQGGQWIADPVIRTIRTGIQLGVLPQLREGGDVEIDMQVIVSEPVRPMAQRDVHLLGAPMTVQSPTLVTQKLSAAGVMEKDRVLLLTGLLGQGDRVVLILVKAAEALPEPDQPGEVEPKKD